MAIEIESTYTSESVAAIIKIPTGNWGFRPRRARSNSLGRLRQRSSTGNGNIVVLGANVAILGWLSQTLGYTFVNIVVLEYRICCHSSGDIIISGFGGHFWLPVYPQGYSSTRRGRKP